MPTKAPRYVPKGRGMISALMLLSVDAKKNHTTSAVPRPSATMSKNATILSGATHHEGREQRDHEDGKEHHDVRNDVQPGIDSPFEEGLKHRKQEEGLREDVSSHGNQQAEPSLSRWSHHRVPSRRGLPSGSDPTSSESWLLVESYGGAGLAV
jgi:hypothetical protein